MKKILFPTDYSTNAANALAYALNFAKEIVASLNILNVVENMPIRDKPFLKTQLFELKVSQLPDSLMTNFIKRTYDSKSLNAPDNAIVSYELASGFPGSEIRVRSKDYSYIVIGKRGLTNFGEKFFGSVATNVLSVADCPVLVVPEKAKYTDVKKILFAVDYKAITTKSVDQMIGLAEALNANLHFVHVGANEEEAELVSEELLEEILTASRTPKVTFEVVIIEGKNVNRTLANYVKENDIDMISMVRSHKSVFRSLFLESHTKNMCYSTDIPLLSLSGNE